MSIVALTSPQDASTVAAYVAWCQGLSNALAAIGWKQAADTGQINWANVTAVPAAGAYTGYEVWQPNDAFAQANGAPKLVVRYGRSGNTSAAGPRVTVALGTTTDGAGALRGMQLTTQAFDLSLAQLTAAAYPNQVSWVSGDGGSLRIACCPNIAYNAGSPSLSLNGGLLSVERSRDAAGNDTTAGYTVAACLGNYSLGGKYAQQFLPMAAGGTPPGGTNPLLALPTWTTGSFGGTTMTFPLLGANGAALVPGLNLLAYLGGDFAPDTVVTIPQFGVAHNYYAVNRANIVPACYNQNLGWLVRYE